MRLYQRPGIVFLLIGDQLVVGIEEISDDTLIAEVADTILWRLNDDSMNYES